MGYASRERYRDPSSSKYDPIYMEMKGVGVIDVFQNFKKRSKRAKISTRTKARRLAAVARQKKPTKRVLVHKKIEKIITHNGPFTTAIP